MREVGEVKEGGEWARLLSFPPNVIKIDKDF
jgi:hypothetical protein